MCVDDVYDVSAKGMLEAPAEVGVCECPCGWVVLKEAALQARL